MQSSSQIVTLNKRWFIEGDNLAISSVFTGRMPFLSHNQQSQSNEGKITLHGFAHPKLIRGSSNLVIDH